MVSPKAHNVNNTNQDDSCIIAKEHHGFVLIIFLVIRQMTHRLLESLEAESYEKI